MQYVKISLPTWRKIEQLLNNADRLGFANRQSNPYSENDTVLVRNDTGSLCERFHVLQISGLVVTPEDSLVDFQQRPIFTGDVPSDTNKERFVVCCEPIESGQMGRAWIDGIAMTQIDVTNSSHTHATIVSEDTSQLQSDYSGPACILWKEGGTGTQWAVIRIGTNSSPVHWAFLKAKSDNTSWTAYLDVNLTGEVITVVFTLTGGALSTGDGHYTLSAGIPIPVMKSDDSWRCLFPLQGTTECSTTEEEEE